MRIGWNVLIAGFAASVAGGTGAGARAGADPPSRDPAIYGHVAHVGWVVQDLDAVAGAWRRLGLTDITPPVEVQLTGEYRGAPVVMHVRRAIARLPNAEVHWLQPLGGENAFTAFLASHGDGVHHLVFHVPSEAQLDQEIASLRAAGAGVVQSGTWDAPGGGARVAYVDTAADGGGLTLALEHHPSWTRQPAAFEPPFGMVTQYAYLVRDVRRVSAYYERLGFDALAVDRNVSLDRRYRGRPAAFEMFLGWGRWSDITFEWIEPIVGPSIYDEHLDRHGEGFHHLAFNVPDLDAAVRLLEGRGLQVTMSGGWDTNGHQGRFAYLDAERHGGVALELLWNKPRGEEGGGRSGN